MSEQFEPNANFGETVAAENAFDALAEKSDTELLQVLADIPARANSVRNLRLAFERTEV